MNRDVLEAAYLACIRGSARPNYAIVGNGDGTLSYWFDGRWHHESELDARDEEGRASRT